MSSSRIPSPARSQGVPITPRRCRTRGSRSVCSSALSNASLKLSSVVEQFKENNGDSFGFSSLGKSMLSDNTEIDEPKSKYFEFLSYIMSKRLTKVIMINHHWILEHKDLLKK